MLICGITRSNISNEDLDKGPGEDPDNGSYINLFI